MTDFFIRAERFNTAPLGAACSGLLDLMQVVSAIPFHKEWLRGRKP